MVIDDVYMVLSVVILSILSYVFSRYQCVDQRKRFATYGVLFLLTLGVYCITDLNWIWLVALLAGLSFGILAYRIAPLWFSVILIFPYTGVSTLSNFSSQATMFFCHMSLMATGYLIYNREKNPSIIGFFGKLTSSLWLYYVISLLMTPKLWLNGLIIGIFALCIGGVFKYLKIGVVWFVFPIALMVYFAFYVFPDFSIQIKKEKLLAHELGNFTFLSKDSTLLNQMKNCDLVLIETWHQYCNSCFACMRDLHPWLSDIEFKNDFQHYYAFVGNDMTYDSVYTFERLPFRDQRVILDPGQDYYNTLQMVGAPYLNFYKKGVYLYSIAGYDPRYESRYKDFIEKEIVRLSKSK